MRLRIAVTLLLILSPALVCLAGGAADMDPVMTAYRDALLTQLDKLEDALPRMTASAEVAADKLLAGGNLYTAGSEGFVSESYVRAGGMMLTQTYSAGVNLTKQDVIFVGAKTSRDKAALNVCMRAKAAGAYVILFSPGAKRSDAPLTLACDVHIDNFSAPLMPVTTPGEDKPIGDTSSLYNVTALWVYTGELIGALTRKGKMPVIWQSVVVPGGRARNKPYCDSGDPSKKRFHGDITVPPQPAGKIGHLFIDVTRRQVAGLRGHTLDQLANVAALMAECVRSGRTVHIQTISHFTTHEVTGPTVPTWVKTDCEARLNGAKNGRQLAQAMKAGDAFFQLGYYEPSSYPYHDDIGYVKLLHDAGAKTIIALCHAPVAPLDGPQPDILIDAQWEYGDAAVAVPGYDVKMLPTSGILQTLVFWTTVDKTESLLRKTAPD